MLISKALYTYLYMYIIIYIYIYICTYIYIYIYIFFFFFFFNKLLFILENSQVHLVFIVPPVEFDTNIFYDIQTNNNHLNTKCGKLSI